MTVVATTGPQTAGAIAREHIARGADLVLAAGGDGVINETAEGMVHSTVPLGIIPGGTANVLAAEVRLGPGLEAATQAIERCQPQRIALGHLECHGGVSRHFLLMAGIGLDALVVYRVSAELKARTGKLAYWAAAMSVAGLRLAQLTVETSGTSHRCSFALASKVRNYGGDFEIAPSVSLLEDSFELVLFEGHTSIEYVKYLAGLAMRRVAGTKGITILRATQLRIHGLEGQRAYAQIDGEYAGRLPAELRIVPKALTLLLPPEYGS